MKNIERYLDEQCGAYLTSRGQSWGDLPEVKEEVKAMLYADFMECVDCFLKVIEEKAKEERAKYRTMGRMKITSHKKEEKQPQKPDKESVEILESLPF